MYSESAYTVAEDYVEYYGDDEREKVGLIVTGCGSCWMELYINMYILYINERWWCKETSALLWENTNARKRNTTAINFVSFYMCRRRWREKGLTECCRVLQWGMVRVPCAVFLPNSSRGRLTESRSATRTCSSICVVYWWSSSATCRRGRPSRSTMSAAVARSCRLGWRPTTSSTSSASPSGGTTLSRPVRRLFTVFTHYAP